MQQWITSLSLGAVAHALLLLVTIPRILAIKRAPVSAIAWILWVFLFPILGSTIFWIVGDPQVRRPLRHLHRGPIHTATRRISASSRRRAGFAGLQRMMATLGETPSTAGNVVLFGTRGSEVYRWMLDDIAAARHEVCVQYYIFRDDAWGRRFARLLVAKARQGVQVHFMYDAVGSSKLGREFLRQLRDSGVEVHAFLPVSILRRRLQFNFRNHRKVIVIDRRVAFTGGMNMGVEYADHTPRGDWYDMHFRITGPAVPQLFEEFAADWDFARERAVTRMVMDVPWDTPVEAQHQAHPVHRGWVQTVSSGPDQRTNRIRQMMFLASTRARERLWIASPYFVPDESMLTALTTAALAGVDVRLLTQNDRPDQRLPYLAARYFWHELLAAGGRIFQYQPGMMHAKMIIADRRFATVGSANLDERSLALNFELNCMFYSQWEIREIERLFDDAFRNSRELDARFLERPLPIRLVENCARLFAPVL